MTTYLVSRNLSLAIQGRYIRVWRQRACSARQNGSTRRSRCFDRIELNVSDSPSSQPPMSQVHSSIELYAWWGNASRSPIEDIRQMAKTWETHQSSPSNFVRFGAPSCLVECGDIAPPSSISCLPRVFALKSFLVFFNQVATFGAVPIPS